MAAAAVALARDARENKPKRPASIGLGLCCVVARDGCRLCNGRGEVETYVAGGKPRKAVCDCVLLHRGYEYVRFHRETLAGQGRTSAYRWAAPNFTDNREARRTSWSMRAEEWLADFGKACKAGCSAEALAIWSKLVELDWDEGGMLRLAEERGISAKDASRLVRQTVLQVTRAAMVPKWGLFPLGRYFKQAHPLRIRKGPLVVPAGGAFNGRR